MAAESQETNLPGVIEERKGAWFDIFFRLRGVENMRARPLYFAMDA